MKKTRKIIFSSILAIVLVLTSIMGENLPSTQDAKADTATETINKAAISKELTSKRSRFVKQFSMSDGSFTAVTYSMPVHYKKNGKWEEINTCLKSKDKKKYKTTSTDLFINVSKKSTPKSVISLKRGSFKLSWALTNKKLKTVEAKVYNPKKIEKTDALNHSQVTYKNILKNTDITYDIFPEKIQEIITIKKKQKNNNISFQIDCNNLKVKVKNNEVCFQTAKGITKYTRLKTTITDDNGVSTTNVKISYDKKKNVLTLTPSKKWWNSTERKFPLEMRTAYITSEHSRDIKVGAAYAGVPNSSFGYDKSLLLQSGKCVAFVKSSTLPERKTANVKILNAALNITNETKLTLGAGKTFDVGIHKVKESWSENKITYNSRPVYETVASSTTSMQKKGSYQCDVTDIVKDWYAGEKNYGVALVADNTNRTWKAKLDKNPSISIRYEIVGFDGATKLKEGGGDLHGMS